MFYKHPKTKDGHVNSCIECAIKLNVDNYRNKLLQEGFKENERLRSRERYYRLNYKERQKELIQSKHWLKNSKYANLRRSLKIKSKEIQCHHWNYNFNYIEDVFLLNRLEHYRAHTFLTLIKDKLIFIGDNGELLDTKDKHKEYLINKGIIFEQEIMTNDNTRKL